MSAKRREVRLGSSEVVDEHHALAASLLVALGKTQTLFISDDLPVWALMWHPGITAEQALDVARQRLAQLDLGELDLATTFGELVSRDAERSGRDDPPGASCGP